METQHIFVTAHDTYGDLGNALGKFLWGCDSNLSRSKSYLFLEDLCGVEYLLNDGHTREKCCNTL